MKLNGHETMDYLNKVRHYEFVRKQLDAKLEQHLRKCGETDFVVDHGKILPVVKTNGN